MKELFGYIISECRNIGCGKLSSVVASYYIPVTGLKTIGNYSDIMDGETEEIRFGKYIPVALNSMEYGYDEIRQSI